MKILITHVYSRDNAGDAAILSVLIEDLKRAFDDPTINISTMENTEEYKEFENIPLFTSFMSLTLKKNARISILLNTIYVISATLLWSYIYKFTRFKLNIILNKQLKSLLNVFCDSDLIIPVGGGYLRAVNNLMGSANLYMLLFPILVGKILNKTVILHSQSIGPFGSSLQEVVTRIVLNKVDLIILREDVSVNLLKKIGVKDNLYIRSVDAGFLFESHSKINIKSKINFDLYNKNQQIVGITVRKWLDAESQKKYEIEIAKFADYLVNEKGMIVVFIPQVTVDTYQDDDRYISQKVKNNMKYRDGAVLLSDKFTHHDIKSLYSGLDYIIGTRFHSVIFSLTSYVPAIAIEYEHKTGGIMKDLGLSDWVIKIEDVNSINLTKKFNDLVNFKKAYLDHLKSCLPAYIVDAKKTKLIIKNRYVFSIKKHD